MWLNWFLKEEVSNTGYITVYGPTEGHITPYTDMEFQLRILKEEKGSFVNTMANDDQAKPGARTSAPTVLIYPSWNILVSAPEGQRLQPQKSNFRNNS